MEVDVNTLSDQPGPFSNGLVVGLRVREVAVRASVRVTTGGKGVASHAGARLVADLADELGLTEALSVAIGPTMGPAGAMTGARCWWTWR